MLLETAVVFVLLPADVTRVPEVVCGGWKDTWLPGLQSLGAGGGGVGQTGPNW